MTQSFNLVDQPWIPCETMEGGLKQLGLRSALADAHTLRGVSADTPLETAALHRLLLTVLHRVFGPSGTEAWFDLWRGGQWDSSRLDTYWAAWYDRFDLLHSDENRRFYQRKPLEGKSAPITQLVISMGNKPALFTHITDANEPFMSMAEAARVVITTQAFRLGGIIKPPISGLDGPAARGIGFQVEGRTLFETMIFNLWAYPNPNFTQATGIPQTDWDAPVWEQDDPIGEGRILPLGYLDYLTWQTYRIWLEDPDSWGHIREAQIGLGQPKLAITVLDPFKHHRADKKGGQKVAGYTPLYFSEDRALWRDSAAILEPLRELDLASKQPFCITWLDTLFSDDDGTNLAGHEHMQLLALGMASKPGQHEAFFYRQERMPIPSAYLHDRRLVSLLKDGLEKAEQIKQALSKALYQLAKLMIAPNAGEEGGRDPRPEDIRPLVAHWNVERQYWGTVEPAFWQFVVDLPLDNSTAALVTWVETLMQAARGSYASAEAIAGSETRALRAAAAGRRSLEWYLAAIRKEIEQWQTA